MICYKQKFNYSQESVIDRHGQSNLQNAIASKNILYIAGVLITGGYPDSNTAELYVPSTGASCTLPSLPDERVGHTVTEGGLLCGGYGPDISDSCLMWSPDSGTWEANVTLDVRREDHVSWTPTSGIGTYLIGGGYSKKTTTLIKNDGSQEPGFPLRYNA